MAVVDLETTGLQDDPAAGILELGAVLLEPGESEVRTLSTLVRPPGPVPLAIQRLTGISDDEAALAPLLADLAEPLRAALRGRLLVAHNAGFERHFLGRFVGGGLGEARYLDTQDLLALTHPDASDLRLETFTRALLGTEEEHRALSDALDTARVLSAVAAGARAGEARYAAARQALESYAADSPWLALLGKGAAAVPAPPAAAFVEVGASSESPVPFDEEAIVAALRDGERGARHFPGYRPREAQAELARHFVRMLRDGGTLLLEGGTGVGKSLAYLAALIPYAMQQQDHDQGAPQAPTEGRRAQRAVGERSPSGRRAQRATGERSSQGRPLVVSTRTKLLQDQLLDKDIPAAARFLGHPELRALSIKGRANYVCERRLAAALAEGREPRIFAEDRHGYAVLSTCAATRRYGEVGAVPGAWLRRYPLLGDLLRRSVAARAEQCTREQCASHPGCPFGRRRAALGEAHLVVANHDLLLRWPPDYPAFAHAVVDEAHELAGVADEVYALEVRPDEVLDRVDEIFGRPDQRRGEALLPAGKRRALKRDAVAWRRGIQQELAALGRSLDPIASEFGEVQVPEHAGPDFEGPARCADAAAARLDAVAAEVDAAVADEDAGSAVGRATEDLRSAAAALRLAFAGSADSVAAFERIDAPFDRWRLAVRLVSPAEPFHRDFMAELQSLACVSASLFVKGDPFAALGELRIEDWSDAVERVSVPSPFAYERHMRVVALRERGELVEETAIVLEQLARRLGGRTLGLFTSLRRMHDVAARLAERLRDAGIDVLTPRRAADDPGALVERFRRGSAVLLGARKFWQGLDIQGDALQAVVIEKLPFEVPTELRRRRELRLKHAGIDAFDRYTLGKMLLNLKQMSGRLIRSEDDRGLVVIVEGRTDRRYFRTLDAALPAGSRVAAADREELDALLAEVGCGQTELSSRA